MTLFQKYLLSSVAHAPADVAGGAAAGGAAAGGAAAGAAAGGAAAGGAAAGAAAGGNDPWYAPLKLEPDAVKFIEDRKFGDLNTILKSHISADELARSRNVLTKPDPTKMNDWDGWETLGWVKDATKYMPAKPQVKEGQILDDVMFADFVKDAHDLRIPVKQTEELFSRAYSKMQERIAGLVASNKTATENAKKDLDTKLRADWGTKYDENSEVSKRAMTALGIGKEDAAELEKVIGDTRLVKLFHTIGSKLGEAALVDGGTASDGMPSNAPAIEAEIRRLQADTAFTAVLNDPRHPQHKDFAAQRQRLIDKLAKLQQGMAA